MESKNHPPDHGKVDATHPSPLSIYRYAAGLSRHELAELAGMSARGLASLERREYLPRLKTARAISEALGVPVHELFPEVGDASR